MKKEDLLSLDFSGKKMVILGKPSSGKTYLSKVLGGSKGIPVIHTDNYINIEEKEALFRIEKSAKLQSTHIIEGMLAYPFLYLTAMKRSYSPDIVILLEISQKTMSDNYIMRGKSVNAVKGFCYRSERFFKEYQRIKEWNTRIIRVKNDQKIF